MDSKPKAQKRPKKITESYLYNSGLYYLQRFAASRAHFKSVMTRKIKKSCAFHENQDFEACLSMLETVTQKIESLGLIDDAAYTRGMVTSLRRSGKSMRAIQAKLAAKGLKGDAVNDVLTLIDAQDNDNSTEAERKAALTFARKKRLGRFRKTPAPADREALRALENKELSALARAGFSYDTARFVLGAKGEDFEDF